MAPAGHGPHAQFIGLGMQFMTTVEPQVGGGAVGQVSPFAQVAGAEPLHQPDSLTFTHW
jgi:hypothetical protein